MDQQRKSQKILCCEARMWALVIGWIQTVLGSIGLLATILAMTVIGKKIWRPDSSRKFQSEIDPSQELVENQQIGKNDEMFTVLILMLDSTIYVITGAILILGVKQERKQKLTIWVVVKIICMIALLAASLISLFQRLYVSFILSSVQIIVTIFCVWIVNVHRREMMDLQGYIRALEEVTSYGGTETKE